MDVNVQFLVQYDNFSWLLWCIEKILYLVHIAAFNMQGFFFRPRETKYFNNEYIERILTVS